MLQVLLQQQQSQIDEAVARAQTELLQKQAVEHNIQLNDFENVLQPIIDSCTKESISNGKYTRLHLTYDYIYSLVFIYLFFFIKILLFKNTLILRKIIFQKFICIFVIIILGKSWILQQCTDSSKCHIISQYLLKK